MSCIICGAKSTQFDTKGIKLFGRKDAITVAYCMRHAIDCVNAKAACFCKIP